MSREAVQQDPRSYFTLYFREAEQLQYIINEDEESYYINCDDTSLLMIVQRNNVYTNFIFVPNLLTINGDRFV